MELLSIYTRVRAEFDLPAAENATKRYLAGVALLA